MAVYASATHAGRDPFVQPLHLALGMFDGVHRGHQAVIRQAVEAAGEPGHLSAVLTFDPHPSHVLRPDQATLMIMPLRQRIRMMLELGTDLVFVQLFTRAYATRSAEAFVPSLVERMPDLRSLHAGENFRFGAGRRGDITTLRESCRAVSVSLHALEREQHDGEPISSSRIRAALAEGAIPLANAMLGHPYLIEGEVTGGKGLGRRMDYPTLNIPWNPEARPRFGVYRVFLRSNGEATFIPGVANYGVRPTVDRAGEPLLEVHLLGKGRVPSRGERVRVALTAFLRPEQAFSSTDALREQISKDVAAARKSFAAMGDSPPLFF